MWKFREMTRGEENVNPVQGEFFSSQEIGDMGEVLVREAIQNSLDARRDKDSMPSELKITYGLSNKTLGELNGEGGVFSGLIEHLRADENGLQSNKIPDSDEKIEYLAVEDFGTCGLNGDPDFDDSIAPLDEAGQHDFFYFWRNIGRSDKQKGELGSWGLGKHVFPAASRINSYFGLTIRSEDERELLMGKTILKIHHMNGKKYAPYGYFGSFDGSEFYALPYEQREQLEAFRKVFKLKRKMEPGLSVVIPFPKLALQASPDEIVKAIVKEYFYPILLGHLGVEIDYLACEPIFVSDETIKKVVHKYLQDEQMLLRMVELAQWSTEIDDADYLQIKSESLDQIPSWRKIEVPDKVIDSINERLEDQGKVALRIPVRVKRTDEDPVEGVFDVCFAQTELMERTSAKYIRQGIDVKEANKSKMDAGCIAIVRIQDSELGEMLRRAEPPAHNKWEQRNNEDLLDRYDNASSTITFVKNAPHEIWCTVMKKEMRQNRDALRDIFHLDKTDISNSKKPKSGNDIKKKSIDEGIEPPNIIQMISTTQLNNGEIGFVVRPLQDATHRPSFITIKTGYRPQTGSALRKYSTHDFRVNRPPIKIDTKGVRKEECRENILKFLVLEPDFEIKVTGFDSNRDLVVNVIPERGGGR